MPEEPEFVDVLGSRIPVLPTAGPRARAWAQAIVDAAPDHEELGYLIQTLITEERNQVLLVVEQALVKEIK